MPMQLRRKTSAVIMSALLVLGVSVQAQAQQSFTVTGPVGWAGWPNTHMSAYQEGNNLMRAVYGTISATVAQVDTDGDGINDDVNACQASNLGATVTVAGAATKVPNTLLANGCTVSDLVALGITIDSKHGRNVSTTAHILNGLVGQGFLSGKNKGALQSALAKSKK